MPLPTPEAVTSSPLSPVRRVLLHQYWADVVFLHWPVASERVAPLLPAGLRADEYGGTSWVGLIHFRMQRLGFGPLPGLPWLGSFIETNVRLYSVDSAGRRGVVFCSLDSDRALPVVAARTAAALPYNWAPSSTSSQHGRLDYASVRRWPGRRGAHAVTRVRPGPRIEQPSDLEHFLTARWALHTSRLTLRGRRTVRWPNDHPAWPLHRAELEHLDEDVITAAGLPGVAARPPASVLYSPGLPVTFGPWKQVGE